MVAEDVERYKRMLEYHLEIYKSAIADVIRASELVTNAKRGGDAEAIEHAQLVMDEAFEHLRKAHIRYFQVDRELREAIEALRKSHVANNE